MANTGNLKIIQPTATAYIQALSPSVQVSAAYLFGSYAKGCATPDSDIDILVISPDFQGDPIQNRLTLMRARRAIDLRIEPHPLHPKDFNPTHPFIKSIQPDLIPIPLHATTSVAQPEGYSP
jgi:predicted nucleotidyltransferase